MENHELPINLVVSNIISKYTDKIFEGFDNVVKGRNTTPNAIVEALLLNGEEDLADSYEEWLGVYQGTLRPDYDPTPQGPELVTDPVDSPSYATMHSSTPGIEWPTR